MAGFSGWLLLWIEFNPILKSAWRGVGIDPRRKMPEPLFAAGWAQQPGGTFG